MTVSMRDHEVVGRDDRLRREGDDLLAKVDQRLQPVDERDEDRQASVERALVAPQSLDDAGPRLRHDPHAARKNEQHQDDDDCYDNERFHGASDP